MSLKIAIFYHIGQINHWLDIYYEQIDQIVKSGLYDVAEAVYCGISGNEELPDFHSEKILYSTNHDWSMEANTLEKLWHFCKENPDYKILYIHTKGVTRFGTESTTDAWRHYLNFHNIQRWKEAIKCLEHYDTCGVLLKDQAVYGEEYLVVDVQYYDGNFWWANSNYIASLDPDYLYDTTTPWLPGNAETWLGTKQFSGACLANIDYINPYSHDFTQEELIMTEKRHTKIVMIAMFKNEAPVLERMLESVVGHIDFWVVQDNGSTDGSDQILHNWANRHGIPGHYYKVDEGWVGFGWNRDHLIQTCQSIDHGCDWILKMDCDEYLEVDSDFDWAPINNTEHQAFHITAVAGSCLYYRSWMWNANLKWRFNHDPCHETIYCADPEIGHAYLSHDLLPGFRQVGGNEGQSWGVPTKFISDSLILEEKLIREQNMLENLYHFWYVGKSYFDAYVSHAFPLGEIQQREFARRAIFYFQEYINYTHDFRKTGKAKYFDETAYMGLVFSGECYEFLKDFDSAILTYSFAESFAPMRNDHLFNLAKLYQSIGDYESMLACTSTMMRPDRVNPFPVHCSSFIDSSMYYDSEEGLVQSLHQIALKNNINNSTPSQEETMTEIPTNIIEYIHSPEDPIEPTVPPMDDTIQAPNPTFALGFQNKKMFIVDNFYADPDAVRQFALTHVEYQEDLRFYKGLRSVRNYLFPEIRAAFEQIIGEPIRVWEEYGNNGCFQITTASDPQVFHFDEQRWAAMIYLTPNAPLESGTRSHRSKINGTTHKTQPGADDAFGGNFYDGTRHEVVDSAGNVYNRLVIMDAQAFHSAGPYFGDSPETGRLTHLFFFD